MTLLFSGILFAHAVAKIKGMRAGKLVEANPPILP